MWSDVRSAGLQTGGDCPCLSLGTAKYKYEQSHKPGIENEEVDQKCQKGCKGRKGGKTKPWI